MKKRRTKVFLSLLAVLAVGFATANAYTFTVENRNPFGVLNLSKLVVKASPSADTGMELEGHILKIAGSNGQIRVHEICNEDASVCKEVSTLGEGSGTPTYGTLTIKRNNVLVDTFTANTNKTINITDNDTRTPNDKTHDGYVTKGQGNAGKVRKVGSDGTPGWGTDETNSTPYTLPLASTEDTGGIKIGYETDSNARNYAVMLNEGKAYVNVPRSAEGLDVEGEHGKWCHYMCAKVNINGTDYEIGSMNKISATLQALLDNPSNNIERLGCRIICNQNTPDTDSEWTNNGSSLIYPTSTDTNVAIGSNSNGSNKLYVYGNTTLEPAPSGSITYSNTPKIVATNKGVSMFGAKYFSLQDANGDKVRGLGVNGPVAVGEGGNYIYMYAAKSTGDDARSYEILGNHELAIGTRAGAFIYFTPRTGTYNNKISYGSRTANNEPYHPAVCTRGVCYEASGHDWHSYVKPNNISTGDVYKSMAVGVNTDKPVATLDVNGSIRIGSNCVDLSTLPCDYNTAGTTMYIEGAAGNGVLAICIKQEGTYTRYDLITNTAKSSLLQFGITVSDGHCEMPKPGQGVYPAEPGIEQD